MIQPNESVHGFRVRYIQPLPELKATLYRMEYEQNGADLVWLDREEEAVPYFERIFTLISTDPETQAFWSDARELLDYCRMQAARKRQQKADEPYLSISRRIW